MVFEAQIDKELSTLLEPYRTARETYATLSHDPVVASLLEQANIVSITRMGYNDHGKVHAKIVTMNAIKIYNLLSNTNMEANIVREGIGDNDNAVACLLIGAYLHDIGISISRDSHDLLGVILARDILARILPNRIDDTEKIARSTPIILEEILCHLGHYRATSLEAKIVATSDGTDMTKGRARIPAKTSKPDIHQFSALAVEHVEITKGDKKPIRIKIEMNDTAGVFQIEHQLVQKITDVGFDDHVEIVGTIKDGPTVTYFM